MKLYFYNGVTCLRALICYNPRSGKQKVGKNLSYIKEKLAIKYSQIDVYQTTGVGSLTTHLKQYANEYDLLLISGGDGTFNEAITGIIEADSKTKIAYIPGGTCNDVGTMLSLPKNIKKAIKLIIEGDSVLMDICQANEKYFAYVFGVGKFIDISYVTPSHLKRRFGRMAYFYYGIKEFVQHINMHAKIETNGQIFDDDYYVILGLNSNHVAGFKIFRKKQIKLNDGNFDLTLIQKKGVSWPRLFRFMLFGDLAVKYGITTITTNEVKISFQEEIACNTDGEFAFKRKDLILKSKKEAINIIVPKKIKNKLF